MRRLLIYLWTLPTTSVGLLIGALALCSGGHAAVVDGVLEVYGGFATFLLRRIVPLKGGASAMTLGHVVIARNATLLETTRAHERVHVRQAERWGPLFLPAYVIISAAIWCRGGNAYRDNPFEKEAFGDQR